ncbi:RNA methyltransferase [Pararhodospirillum photometricum]|uniref:RNA methyltransferase TrmH, group 1 n=1 Tax=Pararhodospirillum photometricum DSM 122 TaxID=1150469 RepID=H6SK72_PARPM|nr:RNA methyltransferase [Pararhodospirillum photometricum]CCG08387.1 RNA methyltransferase TrmH, group 1 [Pararhodospirillum photometricum DSM 122]
MAGTDHTRAAVMADPERAPVIVLVRPQLAENVGMVARAMLNCGLTRLRLVAPREDWMAEKAVAAASGADALLRDAQPFETVEAAIADLRRVYATTARRRDMIKRVLTPRTAAAHLRAFADVAEPAGVLFGPERTGLNNDDVALADAVIEVPLNPAYCSLNLAQAVLLLGYEWFQAASDAPPEQLVVNATRPATRADLLGFFAHLERELDACGFLRNAEKRPGMVRNIRGLFERAALTEQEIRTLHGIVKELRHGRPEARSLTEEPRETSQG